MNEKILVVDDEPGITLLCKRFLTRAGHDVTLMVDPRQAMDYLQEQDIFHEIFGHRLEGHRQKSESEGSR